MSLAVLAAALLIAQAHSPAAEADGFVPIFNGKDLAGWDGKPGWWRVEDGAITAESTPEKPCTKHNYLIWRGGEPADFELRLEFRLVGGNSGVQFRSREVPDWDTRGYQADMDAENKYTGGIYEHARGVIAPCGKKVIIAPDGTRQEAALGDPAELRKHWKLEAWNDYRIVARGPEIQLFLNGKLTAHAVDRQTGKAAARGIFALQMHPGPPMKVQFRNIRLKEFAPTAAATPAAKLKVPPGFKVELLCSPAKETEGSWVSMCADPKGRFYVSGQYDEGLFRITPPPLGGDAADTKVEKIPVELSSAQGLLWAFDSLYALVTKNARTPSGLYRVRDPDGDDQLDTVECLRPLEGGGDHGWHAVLPDPDGRSLCVIAGNNTRRPELSGARVPPHWSEDHLLPRMPDARSHMKGVLAPGGVVYRVSPDGKNWEMVANGFRNTYDAAFNREGELFTYDADMEWDMNTPWYRPTRVCHVTSGSEFGWRNGTGKWPAYYADSLPSVLDIGPGSPTGVAFGYGAKFPARYQDALFMADWTFGKIYAVHLRPEGASFRGEAEAFLTGTPLPTTDIVISPGDGAMYFITGGWRIQTGLYRVTYGGSDSTAPSTGGPPGTEARALRRKLESFHGRRDPRAVETVWPHLGNADRFIRFAARVALEWQDPATWRERALAERNPQAALTALLALVRVSARDEFHRQPGDAVPDAKLQVHVLAALERASWNKLTEAQRLEWLRVLEVTFTRLGKPGEAARQRLVNRLEPLFPASSRPLNAELCQLLVYLESPLVARKALALVARAPTQEEQIEYIKSLRVLTAGWTPGLRREYFAWFNKAAGYRGGMSFAGFMKNIQADAVAALPASEKEALAGVLEAPPVQSPQQIFGALLAGRTNTTEWTVAVLAPQLERGLRERDFARGRAMFGAAGCFSCHRFASEGGAAAPDLTQAAGRFSPRDLLEATLEPSKAVSDLYGNVVITKLDGETVTGRIVYLRGDSVQVGTDMFNPAETLNVDRKDVKSIEPSRISPMPEGLLNPLTREEIFDLIAYVLSGGDAGNAMFSRKSTVLSVGK